MMQSMPDALPPPGALRRIAVFRALQLGDMLCVVPALRALRRAAPGAFITLIGLPWAREFASRFHHYLDDFIAFPGFPGLPEQAADAAALPHFLNDVRERRFELAIQLHGSGALSNSIVALLDARRQAGFHVEGAWCPDPATFLRWGEPEHEVLRYLRLMGSLGCGDGDAALEFPFDDADRAAVRALEPLPPGGRYVCLHAGARLPSRRWPAVRFAQVADGLAARGWHVVLTGGAQEGAIAGEVLGKMAAPALDLTGRTTLGALALLVSRAGLLVSNDTAVSHLAAASGTPSVIVSSGADPVRWAPLDHGRHRVLAAPAACRPCAFETCPIGHPCALDVSADQVLEAALAMGEGGAGAWRRSAVP
ncbi:MAG: biosynthesis glycosyltransferase [Massilia sp.]|nr:biosynthesis glycosyltransferase [Massilia sp.]